MPLQFFSILFFRENALLHENFPCYYFRKNVGLFFTISSVLNYYLWQLCRSLKFPCRKKLFHTFSFLAGNECAVEESSGHSEKRPVLLRLKTIKMHVEAHEERSLRDYRYVTSWIFFLNANKIKAVPTFLTWANGF